MLYWPPFALVVYNDIANDMLIYCQKLIYIALSSFLELVLCFFWNDITATAACIKGERWKPCGNENFFNETYPIQQASY
ncbi:hypothetical protein SLA2020_242710 [Shorea laevis]